MAEFASRQLAAKQATRTKYQPTDHGRISVGVATTPATAAWAQNDTWATGIIIPKGSRILRSGRLSHGAFGASVTASVGLRGITAAQTVIAVGGIAAGLDVSGAGAKELDLGTLFAAGVAYVTTEDAEVYVSLLGANPTDNAQAEVEIHWLGPTA